MFSNRLSLRLCGLMFAGTLVCTGCQTPRPAPQVPAVDAARLIARYNQRAELVQRLWAHVVIEAQWTDADGETHHEQGDGQLYVRKPHELALSIGKLGDEYFWLGSNAERFWWLDEKPTRNQPSTAYVGRNEDIGKAGMPRLPTPIPPDQLLGLLGVNRLPEGAIPSATVSAAKSGEPVAAWFEVSIPMSNTTMRERLLIGAVTGRPQAIVFLDQAGRTIAEARLSEYRPMKIPGIPLGGWPDVATRVEVRVPREKSKLTLYMDGVTGDPGKFKDALFDFAAIKNSRNPQVVRELKPKP